MRSLGFSPQALGFPLTYLNIVTGKGLTYRKLTEYTMDQLQKNPKRADVKTAKDWSFGSYLLWQSLAVTMNVQKAAFDKDQEKMRMMVGLD